MKLFNKDYVGKGGKLAMGEHEVEIDKKGCTEVKDEETCAALMKFAGFKGAAQVAKESAAIAKKAKEKEAEILAAADAEKAKDLEEIRAAEAIEKAADDVEGDEPKDSPDNKPAPENKEGERKKPAFLRNRGK